MAAFIKGHAVVIPFPFSDLTQAKRRPALVLSTLKGDDLMLIEKHYEVAMKTAKEEVKTLLEKLPEDCTIEDIQYHLYVLDKIQEGIERAEKEGTISNDDAKKRLSKWLTE